jgi:hypothetical protein
VAIREFAVVVGAVLAVTILKEPMDCCKVHVLEISSTTRFLPACFLLPASCFLLPASCHLPPASSFLLSPFFLPATRPLLLLPATCFLPSASCQLLPASSYLLPASCFLPSASCQLLPARYPPAAAASSHLLPAASDLIDI